MYYSKSISKSYTGTSKPSHKYLGSAPMSWAGFGNIQLAKMKARQNFVQHKQLYFFLSH